MVLLGLAAGGVAANTALGTFSYNRNGWMTDVQVNQTRRYQRQNVRLMQAEMFREDIRDLVGSSVTKQSNYVLLATLILTMIAECYVEGPLPDGAAEFVKSAYQLCLGSSILYLVMSILCAVSATHLATSCQKDLLTTLVRLPVDEFVAEIDAAAYGESVEAFENQGVSRMFRLPMLGRMGSKNMDDDSQTEASTAALRAAARTAAPSETPSDRRKERRMAAPPAGSAVPAATLGDGYPSVNDIGEELLTVPQEESSRLHLDVFHEREREWDVLGRFAFVFGASGATHLLQAYGYFSAAKYYKGDDWACAIVQILLILVDAILVRIAMNNTPRLGILRGGLNVVGPLACILGIRVADPEWVDQMCIPLCFICHMLAEAIGIHHLFDIMSTSHICSPDPQTPSFVEAARPQRKESAEFAGVVELHRRRPSKTFTLGSNTHMSLAHTKQCLPHRRFFLVFLGNGLVVAGWFATAIWAVVLAGHGLGDNGRVIMPERRLVATGALTLRSAQLQDMPSEVRYALAAEEVHVAWPSKRFRPHALACASAPGADRGAAATRCFAANAFMVFELAPPGTDASSLTAEAPWSASPVPCDLAGGEIVDLAALCGVDGTCNVQALVRNPAAGIRSLICGAAHSDEPRLPELAPGATGLRLFALGEDATSMYAADGQQVLEFAASPHPAGGPADAAPVWSPLWPVAKARSDADLVAIDFARVGAGVGVADAAASVLLLVYADGVVESLDVDSGSVCGTWSFASLEPFEQVRGASALDAGVIQVLTHAIRPVSRVAAASPPTVRMMRAVLPEEALATCGRSAPDGEAAADATAVRDTHHRLRGSALFELWRSGA